jgi:hypothetical protein
MILRNHTRPPCMLSISVTRPPFGDLLVLLIYGYFLSALFFCPPPHGVTASAGQRRGNVPVETNNYLRDQAGSRSLVFDLSITHERFGSSSHPQQNRRLTHPQDIDAPLHIAAQRKINSCRQQSEHFFLPAISVHFPPACTASFCVFFFYRPTGRPRRTSLPLACHRNATNWTRSGSSALHSSNR